MENHILIGRKTLAAIFISFLILLLFFFTYIISPRACFPASGFLVLEGNLSKVAEDLTYKCVIRYSLVFKILAKVSGNERNIKAGEFIVDKPLGTVSVLKRIINADFRTPVIRVTIPEGKNSREIADILDKGLGSIDGSFKKDQFLAKASIYEGYLFPDTYFFKKTNTAEDIIRIMRDNFDRRTKELYKKVSDRILAKVPGTHTFKEYIIMASILEKETNTPESHRIVSGILWKRISIGMPLQVDASFVDINIDSPYNTYKYKGLPPGPISNPGLETIEAAINPTASDYLYYLNENSATGAIHYASTHDEHVRNKQIYLK